MTIPPVLRAIPATRSVRIAAVVFAAVVLSVLPLAIQAQTDSSCPALVELALSQVGNNCGELGRNSACYGYNSVQATVADTAVDVSFSRPADKAQLASLRSIRTSPLDLGLGQWGIAVLNVQANVPDTLPGQAVTFLLMGDAEVENAVAVENVTPVQPITLVVQAEIDARSAPEPDSPAVAALPAGTEVQADAISADGTALRIFTESGMAWISRIAVNPAPEIDTLPVTSSSPTTGASPMQAFYLRTGLGEIECSQTPSVVAIQSPENIQVDLNANGADIRLGSLITLQILPGDLLKLTTLDGNAILNPDTPNQINVPAGFTTVHCLAEAANLGEDGEANDQPIGTDCTWQEPREATPEELDTTQTVLAAFDRLGLFQPTRGEPSNECPVGTTIVHTVLPGENLYRIGLRYRTSIGAIVQANNLASAQVIYVGQQLTIPCGVDTGLPTVPNIPPVVTGTPATTVNCTPFRATSPLDGLPYGQTTFYWDAAPGATGYRVNVYNVDERRGALVASYTAAAGSTNLSANLTIQTVGFGFTFAWEVQALFNNQVACSSGPFTVPRAPEPTVCPSTASC